MRINYSRVIKQANQIDDLGGDLKRVERDLKNLMVEIPVYWKGEAATAYLKVCDDLRQKISTTSQKIITTSNEIKTVAKHIHDEDERMARAARNLKTNSK